MADCFSLPNAAELVEQLRSNPNNVWMAQAADAIEQLTDENRKLRTRAWAAEKDCVKYEGQIYTIFAENAQMKSAFDEYYAANEDLFAKLEDMKKERDAAVADLKDFSDSESSCFYCRKINSAGCTECIWEWRGVQDEAEDTN